MRNIFIKLAFLALFLWWAYLFFATQFVVVFDSEGYEKIGQLVAHHGWTALLQTGPQREPMFLGLVALSMRLGEWWGISYDYPLKMIGLFFLSLTIIYAYRLMQMLSIRRWIALLCVFYMGISPALTFSSIRLWSEFAAYPWVVLAVIWTIKSWRLLDQTPDDRPGIPRILGHAAMMALMFLLVMFVKAVTEGVLILYLVPFYWRIFAQWRTKNFFKAKQAAVFCLAVLVIFEGGVCAYKFYNYRCNGHFVFTDRGDWALYGNTARRMQPLTFNRLGAAVLDVPGMGLCPAVFSQEDCDFWSARHSDDIINQKGDELTAQGITGDAASRYYVSQSVNMILSNPAQEALLMFIEGHKMFFWEPCLSFVAFPDWMERILYAPLFFNTIMVILAFLTWISGAFAFFYLSYRFWKPDPRQKERDGALGWVFNFIFLYIAMYSLFFILDRYAYPLISLYIVLMAFMGDQLVSFFTRNTKQLSQNRALSPVFKVSPVLVAVVISIALICLWLGKKPIAAFISKEHQFIVQKSKVMTISYYNPYFPYYAGIVAGREQPNKDWMQGYYFGRPYTFHDYYKKAVDLFPEIDSGHYLLGYCDYYRGDVDLARAQFEKSVDLNPYFFWSYYNLGVIYFQQGDFYKSAVTLNKALSARREFTLEILHQSPFYQQVWRNVANPRQVLDNNLGEGQNDAALLLAACFVKGAGYDQALQITRSVGQNTTRHKELWMRLQKIAVNKQRMTAQTGRLIQEQIPVRLF